MRVRPKKHLGQHFLTDTGIAEDIVSQLSGQHKDVLELGPGMGVLTNFLIQKDIRLTLIDIDEESVNYLIERYPQLEKQIILGDFLTLDFKTLFKTPFALIGNFPYNISSQIMFKVLEAPEMVPEVVGMFQMEVAKRIASPPGNKDYGILSVLFQARYNIRYCFTVPEHVFDPPPKVKSGVIHCLFDSSKKLSSTEADFKRMVKTTFNQRRKTIRNSIKPLMNGRDSATLPFLDKRPEQLSWQQFDELTLALLNLR